MAVGRKIETTPKQDLQALREHPVVTTIRDLQILINQSGLSAVNAEAALDVCRAWVRRSYRPAGGGQ